MALNSYSGLEAADDTAAVDYRELYAREIDRREQLERELAVTEAQSRTFSRELANVYQHTKNKRKQLADTNEQLVRYAADLRTTLSHLKSAHRDLQEAYRDTIDRLVLASEYKDKDTGNHITRMSRYSALVALRLGLDNSEVEAISFAAPMHDVGKIGIPDCIILKNGMLTEREFSVIKTHTTIGAGILESSKAKILQIARIIALSHHEKWDGTGYPNGLAGEEIPLSARIVALSDTFDALTSKRPYKSPYPIEVSCDIILDQRGKHFDPELVDIFLKHIDEIASIKQEIDQEPDSSSQRSLQFAWSERDLSAQLQS